MKTCGLDVHKDTIFCAIYNGKSYLETKEFSTLTPDIRKLGEYLKSEKVKRVAMESTATYWLPVWDLLYDMGLELTLVNPYLVKQMPGRKSDVKDAQWIACLLYKGLLRGSFVPKPIIQELRSYTRTYTKLQGRRTSCLTKMDRILVGCGIRLSSCVSTIGGKSSIKVINALITGENNPDNLVKLVYGNTANKTSGRLKQALTGNLKPHHITRLKWEKQEYDLTELQISECLFEMERICKEHYAQELDLLRTIPGISLVSAIIVIAETGGDMSVFENSGKLTGWTGLRPRNDQSAGKYKSTATTKGNKYLRTILVQIAWAAVRTKRSLFMEKFNRLAMRKSRKKALIAISRKILVVVWNVLQKKNAYNPILTPIYDPEKLTNRMKYHQKEFEKIKKIIA